MDTKALAKSKRAHSLQHSKKPQSNKPSKAHSSRNKGSGLLASNWDRYEEELDFDANDVSTKPSDVVLPKSKGADYNHLIAEAKSQIHSSSYLDLSLDQVLPGDFDKEVSSMLSVRGKGIISWIGEDNFGLDDEETASGHEASFLSLNLHALGEQLAKVDLCERLYIEADLLLPDLCKGSSTSCCQEFVEKESSESKATATTISEELDLVDFDGTHKVVDNSVEVISSNSSRALQSLESFDMRSAADPHEKLSSIDAATAEAELDMLLESFNETKLLDSSGPRTSDKEVPISLTQHTKNNFSSSKTTSIAANLDHELDDLLGETFYDDLYQHGEVKAATHKTESSSSQSGTKSKALDDFDSWLDTI